MSADMASTTVVDTLGREEAEEHEESDAEGSPGNSVLARLLYRFMGPVAPAIAGFVVGNVFVIVVGLCTVILFWIGRSALVPKEFHQLPVYLQYPAGWQAPRHAINVTADACADVQVIGKLPVGQFEMDASLHIVTVPADTYRNVQLQHGMVMCALELLMENSSEVVSSSRPLFLPEPHWLTRVLNIAIRGPFVALGLLSDERVIANVQMLEFIHLQRHVFASIDKARVCLRPPLPTFNVDLNFNLRVVGFRRTIQGRPWTVSVCIFISTVICGWGVMGCLGVMLFLSQTCRSIASNTSFPEGATGDMNESDASDAQNQDGADSNLTSQDTTLEGRCRHPSTRSAAANSAVIASVGSANAGIATSLSESDHSRGPSGPFTGVRRRLP